MGYFREKRRTRLDDKWMFTFLLLVSAASVIAVGLCLIFADKKRKVVLKDPTDYWQASNSYPVKTLQRVKIRVGL